MTTLTKKAKALKGKVDSTRLYPLADALAHMALQYVQLKGVNHVLRDDPSDNVGNYAKKAPLSPQLIAALDQFVTK